MTFFSQNFIHIFQFNPVIYWSFASTALEKVLICGEIFVFKRSLCNHNKTLKVSFFLHRLLF